MPRPKTKDELLKLSKANCDKLLTMISDMDADDQTREFPPGTMNRNVRDVLGHLHHWHLMMLSWYEQGMAGIKPAMPENGYTWKTVPELNRKIWEKYGEVPLEEILNKFERSHREVMDLIEKHTDEELFEKKRYKWTGSTSLGAYLISATSSHYDWAIKLLRKATKDW